MKLADRLVVWGVATLIVVSPLPMGSVHLWALGPLEVAIFSIGAVWLMSLWRKGGPLPRARELRRLILPGVAFFGLVLFQLCPLPPRMIRIISPSTYTLFETALPGWPEKSAYSGFRLADKAPTPSSDVPGVPIILPTAEQVHSGAAALPFTPGKDGVVQVAKLTARAGTISSAGTDYTAAAIWRPLSIGPAQTYRALLEMLALSTLFLIVVCYRIDDEPRERTFYRAVLTSILVAGALVAVLGIIERVWWNGKILWVFVPTDWGVPMLGPLMRASGPFVNPDHFANYLSMVLPLTIAAALLPTRLAPAREPGLFRVLCFASTLAILSAMVLSLSRGGWLAGLVAVTILLGVLFRATPRKESVTCEHANLRTPAATHSRVTASKIPRSLFIVGFCAVAALALVLVGPEGREQTGERLEQTATGGGNLLFRVTVWEDSLPMFRDFPVAGVGLGAWPELFPRYERAPWSNMFLREAHNDFVQLLNETGVIGFSAGVAFLAIIGAELFSGFARLDPFQVPLFVAIVAGLVGAGIHEFFDFSFRIPANALLFTVLLGLALRMALKRPTNETVGLAPQWSIWCLTGLLLLVGAAMTQHADVDERDAASSRTLSGARDFIIKHPASSPAHLALALQLQEPAKRRQELERAIWLSPTNPSSRDAYATFLAQTGQSDAEAEQLTASIFNSPDWATHTYLNPRVVLWLFPRERKAIELGFRKAIANNYDGALNGLARLYDTFGRFAEEAELYADTATREKNSFRRATYLLKAGEAYSRAGDRRKAETVLLESAEADPENLQVYADLLNLVYVPENRMSAASAIVERGVANGLNPADLYALLANSAAKAGDSNLAQQAMVKRVEYAPTFDNTMQLGELYLAAGQSELATAALERATQINPTSSNAYHALAVAKERGYDYAGADEDYSRAVALAPRDVQLRREYDEFRHRMRDGGAH